MHKENQSPDSSESINKLLVSYRPVALNKKLACISLNKPKALNALDLDMIRMFLAYLEQWRHDDTIVGVFIDSVSDKAFCAGGDIVSLYQAISTPLSPQTDAPISSDKASADDTSVDQKNAELAAEFFAQEYRLDYCLHSYPKPVIAWGHGIIMGGGLGIFAGAHIRIVTEHARVAMPEINIGLFPDVGASYFLNQMPKGVGRFLGLTASSMNAKDCINTNLANYLMPHQSKSMFLDSISKISDFSYQGINSYCAEVTKGLNASSDTAQIIGNLDAFKELLGELDELQHLDQINAYLLAMSEQFSTNQVINRGYKSFLKGSPITAHIFIEQLARGVGMPLADCFRMELNMAYGCCASGEFKEGIRALLIDKDNSPNWRFKHFNDVPKRVIDQHFNHYSESDNPLAQLELTFGEHYA